MHEKVYSVDEGMNRKNTMQPYLCESPEEAKENSPEPYPMKEEMKPEY
jgi:hypothetical protein